MIIASMTLRRFLCKARETNVVLSIKMLQDTFVAIHSQTLLKKHRLLSFQTFFTYSGDVCSTHNVDLRERRQCNYLIVGDALTSFHVAV